MLTEIRTVETWAITNTVRSVAVLIVVVALLIAVRVVRRR